MGARARAYPGCARVLGEVGHVVGPARALLVHHFALLLDVGEGKRLQRRIQNRVNQQPYRLVT